MLPIVDEVPKFKSIDDLQFNLLSRGCRRCDLGFQKDLNGCCVARGDPGSGLMIIGEAPGKYEDASSLPFVGPAGQLLDKIWASVGMDTNDWYVTNTVLCRPIATKGSGRENLTPKAEQGKRCRLYLRQQIDLIKPYLIVTLGRVATEAVCGVAGISMGKYRGKILTNMPVAREAKVVPVYHPSYLLRNQGTKIYERLRQETWQDINTVKRLVEEIFNG